jgi:hypothetical protein
VGSQSLPPPRKRSRRGLWAALLVVVVILVVIAYLYDESSPVDIANVGISSTDGVCGAGESDAPTGWVAIIPGFSMAQGSTYHFTWKVPNYNSSSCTINGVTTSTSGFSVSGANVPLTIPADENRSLSFNIGAPHSPYDGDLAVVLT